MKPTNVLITATGTGIGQSVIKGLRLSKRDYGLVGTDVSAWSAGIYRCDRGYLVPKAIKESYIPTLKGIAAKESIDVIIPGCDPELLVLAKAKEEIKNETTAIVVVGPPEVVEVCRDKYLTSIFLKRSGFPYPKTAVREEAKDFAAEVRFPLVVKPRRGSGTQDVSVVFDRNEMNRRLKPGYIVQEYLIPRDWPASKELTKENLYSLGSLEQVDEYSTEVLISKSGSIIASIVNWRTMKKGYPIRAIVDDFPEIQKQAEKVAESLSQKGLIGPCNLQCRLTERGPVFFEINPRFSGSTAVRCVAGFNGPDAIVANFSLKKSIGQLRKELNYRKLVEIRWWNELYIDPEVFRSAGEEKMVKFAGEIYDYF